jgi:hypothetical protein
MSGITSRAALVAACSLLWIQAPAQAGSAISAWVSGSGQDASGCGPLASPCRTFQYAHDNVLGANGGDILVKDSGNYGPLNVTKSVSIINDGAGTAGTGAPSGQTAITVNTTGNVLLKGLTIDGVGVGGTGISVINTATTVTIANCVVQNFTDYGIRLGAATRTLTFSMSDTLVQNNGDGIDAAVTFNGAFQGVISNSSILNNGGAGHSGSGIATSGRAQFTVTGTLISGNDAALFASISSVVALRHSTITWNGAFQVGAYATIQTYGDNVIANNGGTMPTLTPVQLQ